MVKHTFLLIYRNLKRFKSSFFINLIGLSVGLASALLIFLWVNTELHVDKFFKKDSQLFQVMEHQKHTGSIRVTDSTPGLLSKALAEEMPEVEYAATATPTYWFGEITLSIGDKNIEADGKYAGKDFFKIFSYHLIQGNKNQVLSDTKSIVISKKLALKLFDSTQNIVGKTIEWQHSIQYRVSGIFEVPGNSSDQFDFVLPFKILAAKYPGVTKWENSGPDTYVLLKKGTNVEQFNKKIAHFISTKIPNARNRTLFIRRYSDAYLHGNYENGVQSGGRIEYVRLFSVIVIFIVFIACINFMNLSTAKASGRMKEIGVKKLLGARRGSLVLQYIGESVLIVCLAMVVGIILVAFFLPQFNDITGKHITLALSGRLLISLVGITLVTGIIAGSYPAFYLSRLMPAGVIKGKFAGSSGEVWVRKGLVIFQFAISVILIISVLAVSRQIDFVQTKNPGFTKQHIISFDVEGKVAEKEETFLSEIRNIQGVTAASSIGEPGIIGGGNTVNDLQWPGKSPGTKIPFARRPVNYGLLKMLDIKMESGRSFSRQFGSDSTKIIFNEAAIKAMGLKDPIGKTIQLEGRNRQIIGVVRDFHFESLYNEVDPLFFILKPDETQKIMVKLEPGKERETISRLHNFYQKFNPGFTFDYSFLDQQYQAQYNAVQRVSVLSRYFALIAILISCLGLFGLVAFTAERRQKEIGIRKVLGSSVTGIVALLSKDFLKLVGIGFLIAVPIGWYAMHLWLQNFAYHIDIGVWMFVLAGVLAMAIALLTVSWQSVRAAIADPVKSLRNE